MVLLAGLVLVLGPGRDSACLASDDAGTGVVRSPSALEIDFVEAQNADWKTFPSVEHTSYGQSVASAGNVNGYSGDDILVGAPKDFNPDTGEKAGVVYLYLSSGGALNDTPAWVEGGDKDAALFGHSVAGAGDVNKDTCDCDDVIIGAPDYKAWLEIKPGELKEVKAGGAFVYKGDPGLGLSGDPIWSYTGPVQEGEFGWSVAGVGDLNKDGFDDIAVGAMSYHDDVSQDNEGAIYVFFGSASGPSVEPDWIIDSDQANARLGSSVSAAGDVNGDGYDDLIAGARNFMNPETELREGAVFLFLGRETGTPAPTSVAHAAWRAYGWQEAAWFGYSVASAGYVNDDDHPDIVVGAPLYHRPSDEVEAGAAFVFCGNGSRFGSDPCWTAYGSQPAAQFGFSAAGVGDVNDDGYDDVIVGAPTYLNYLPDGTRPEGAAFLYFGSETGLAPWAGWKARGDRSRTDFGASLGSAGDVDNDGGDDIVIGAPQYFVQETAYGGAFAFYGPLEPGELDRTYLPLVLLISN